VNGIGPRLAGVRRPETKREPMPDRVGRPALFTIGYEHASVGDVVAALTEVGVDLLVDVRAVASSRRPGFSKSRLATNLQEAGIGYLHLRALGTPADGRAAARAGRQDELRAIYLEHLETRSAVEELRILADLVRQGRRACLLCLEADAGRCHRSMVADAVNALVPIEVVHLSPQPISRD
jgi:uncharacterized protein (DUF488 family)